MDSLLAIYPTARKVEDLLKRQSRERCQMGHRVVTFPQLLDALWREYGADRVMLSTIGERIAIEEAMGRAKNVGAIAARSGLTDYLHAVVRQLKSAALTAEDLRLASKALSLSGTARVEMVAAILASYEALLDERGLADTHDRERAVLDALLQAERQGTRPRFLAGVTHLLVAEIYDFGLLQFMIVAALIRIVGDAELTIQAEPHAVSANRFPELTWNRFVSEESIADKVLPQFVRRGGRQGRLGFLLTHIFSGNYPTPPPPDRTVSIIEAPSRRREVEEVARMIRRVLERPPSERIPLDRIAVVTRDLNPYAEHLEAIFRRYRIPLRLDATQPLRAAPPARFITDLLKIPRDGYRREAILGLLNTPYVRVAARAHRSMLTETGYIDRVTMPFDERIARRRREVAEALDQEANQGKRAALQGKLSRTDAAAKAFAELFAVLETLEPPATVADHVERLSAALDRLDPASHSLADAAAAAMGPLYGALEELAREARMIAPKRVVSLDEFAALTDAVFAETTIENRKRSEQGVEALSVIDARGLDFDLAFVIGLNDGAFPLYHRDDPLISDELKLALNRPLATALRRRFGANAPNALGRILRTRYDRNAEDWFLFFLALSMPEREVVLSYSAADENGNPLLRSPFVDEVLKLLGEHAYEDGVRRTGTVVRRVGAGIPAPDDCFAADEFLNFAAQNRLLDHAATSSITEPERLASIARRSEIERRRESYLTLPTREDRAKSASSVEKLALASLYDGRVTADGRLHRLLLQKTDGTPRAWSASQLSEFASCGFKYFAGRILSLREEDEPDYEQSPLESGDAVHEILREIVARGVDFSDRRAARAAAGKVLAEQYAWRHREARDPTFFDVQWRSVKQMVEEAIEYETRRRDRGGEPPSQLEPEFALSFAIDESGTKLTSEPLRVALEGRIDRLELYRAGHSGPIRKIKVVDYKTSRNLSGYADKLKNELGVTDFQIPVYALGALTSFGSELAPDATIEASYLVLRSREKETLPKRLDNNDLELDPRRRAILVDQGTEPYADRVVRLVRAAVNGEFDVDPLKCDPWCPHRRLCRYYKPAS